tara:strand:+ start:143 stop:553 length:411 start_codon:yes stop_codon:yes gene_type:complete
MKTKYKLYNGKTINEHTFLIEKDVGKYSCGVRMSILHGDKKTLIANCHSKEATFTHCIDFLKSIDNFLWVESGVVFFDWDMFSNSGWKKCLVEGKDGSFIAQTFYFRSKETSCIATVNSLLKTKDWLLRWNEKEVA